VKSGKELFDRAAAGPEANIDSCAVQPSLFRFRDESTDKRDRVQRDDQIAQRLSVRLIAVMESYRLAHPVNQQHAVAFAEERT
jgi:hypothetical protein